MRGLFAFLLAVPAGAAFESRTLSAREAALGGAATAMADGAALWRNPAALRFLDGPEAHFFHTRLWGESGLPVSAFSAAVPTRRWGAWGAGATDFGNALYRERSFAVCHALCAAPGFAVGTALSADTLRIDRYGASTAWSLDAGLFARVSGAVDLAAGARRINRPRFSGSRQGPAPETRLGAAWRPWPSYSLNVDVVRGLPGRFQYRLGQEWRPAPKLFLRAGGVSRPAAYALGLGVDGSFFRLDYAFTSHPFLGDQHLASMAFPWGK